MSITSISIFLAFAAGAASFLSPCVLPLVPAYLAFLGGGDAVNIASTGKKSFLMSKSMLAGAVSFVIGLSLFIIVAYYIFYSIIVSVKFWLLPLLGCVVIIFGLQYMGILKIPFLLREKRISFLHKSTKKTVYTGFLLGLGFAAGWTPCLGPVLGAVLSSAVDQGTTTLGFILIAFYCIGLGAPFIIVAIFMNGLTPILRKINKHQTIITKISGLIIVLMGFLIIFDRVSILNLWFSQHLPSFFNDPFNL